MEVLQINLYNVEVFNKLKDWISSILNQLDSYSWGSFSLLDLALGFLIISAFLPVVLNLRNVESVGGFGMTAYDIKKNRRWVASRHKYVVRKK